VRDNLPAADSSASSELDKTLTSAVLTTLVEVGVKVGGNVGV
jgi:hypothetical protein